MTKSRYRTLVNVTAVIAAAMFAGGGLLILVSYGIRWLGTDPLAWRAGFWAEFMNFAITIIPLNMIALLALVLSARLDWHDLSVRWLWMWAIGLYAANTVFTLGYFIPQNILLIQDSYTATEASTVRATWLGLHVVRVAVAVGVPVLALLATLRPSSEAAVQAARP